MAQSEADEAAAAGAGPAQGSAGGAASSGQAPPVGAPVSITERAEDLVSQIARLQKEQRTNRELRARVNKDLKNAKRRKTRLTHTAKRLSDEDLLAVVQMRADARANKQQPTEQSGPSNQADAGQSAAG